MKRRSPPRHPLDLSRRRFLAGAAGAASSLILPACGGDPGAAAPNAGPTDPNPPDPGVDPTTLPKPEDSGIDHIVHVQMENRSSDHLLGWLPNADGMQNQVFLNNDGVAVP